MHSFLQHLALSLLCLAFAGCATRVDVVGTSGSMQLTIASTVAVPACTTALSGAVVTQGCHFADVGSGAAVTTTIDFAGVSPEDDVQSVPVIVLQVPLGATDFVGTYDNGSSKHGRMLVSSGLSVLPADSMSSVVAEAGAQLVVLELPGDAGAGTFTLTLSYLAPSTQLKVVAAAKVTATGSTYYAPIVPCTIRFDAVPAVPIASNAPLVDVASIAPAFTACPGKTYIYASVPPPRAVKVTVYEFYNQTLDHYFITWVPAELAALDSGAVRGWARTGASFNAYVTAEAGTSAVCRFYIPPQFGDSHFFGRGARECADTGSHNPAFVLEAPAFMYVALPVLGVCPAGTQPVYRAFSNRPDANHRYMTDRALRDTMTARGWIAEGDGPDLIVMCGPL